MSDRRDILKHSLVRFLTVMGDLLSLNLLWILCCIPIVTIGPATCAMLTVTLKLARDECDGTMRTFFNALRDNFKNGFLLSLLTVLWVFIALIDIMYAFSLGESPLRYVFLVVSGIVCAVGLTFSVYSYPLQVRYTNTIEGISRNSFFLAFCFPVSTLVLWVITASPVILFLSLPGEVLVSIAWMYILFGASLPAFLSSIVLRNVFDRSQEKQAQ